MLCDNLNGQMGDMPAAMAAMHGLVVVIQDLRDPWRRSQAHDISGSMWGWLKYVEIRPIDIG